MPATGAKIYLPPLLVVLAEPCSECECWERRSPLDLPIARWYPY